MDVLGTEMKRKVTMVDQTLVQDGKMVCGGRHPSHKGVTTDITRRTRKSEKIRIDK
jgi:hypothetical protein